MDNWLLSVIIDVLKVILSDAGLGYIASVFDSVDKSETSTPPFVVLRIVPFSPIT